MLPSTNEQAENLERVSCRISRAILAFCRDRYVHTTPPMFRMQDLLDAVNAAVGVVAPDSPSRILRKLRKEGRINYVVLNRANSLYQLKAVAS